MAKIKKFLPSLLIPLDILALLAFQNITQCSGANINSADLLVVECGNAWFDGAYSEGFGGS